MKKRTLVLTIILGALVGAPGIMLGMDNPYANDPYKTPPSSPRKPKSGPSNKENLDPNTQPSSPQRPTSLQGTFTRRPERLKKLAHSKSPKSKEALLAEAKRLTPYLAYMYASQYDTSDVQKPSPLKEVNNNKRKKNQKKAKELTREHVRIVRQLFTNMEEWDETIETPYGYTINQNDAIINPLHVDNDGHLNLHRMLNGLAPIGPDGRSVNLHHWLREDPAPEGEQVLLGELTRGLHTRESGVLHFPTDEGIRNRSPFNSFRQMYWRARAADIIETNIFGG